MSKAAAIDCIGKLYDFTPAETIAIGDGFNDLSMIRYAALGVAMANAPDGVKESADYITARTNMRMVLQKVWRNLFYRIMTIQKW